MKRNLPQKSKIITVGKYKTAYIKTITYSLSVVGSGSGIQTLYLLTLYQFREVFFSVHYITIQY